MSGKRKSGEQYPPLSSLRGQDSNLRPFGYEPNELPTAPPHNANIQIVFKIKKRTPKDAPKPNYEQKLRQMYKLKHYPTIPFFDCFE